MTIIFCLLILFPPSVIFIRASNIKPKFSVFHYKFVVKMAPRVSNTNPQVSEISSMLHNNHPETPDDENSAVKMQKQKGERKDYKGDFMVDPFKYTSSNKREPLDTVYDLVTAVLAYGCANDVLEQNGNLYCFRTKPATPGPAACCEKCGCNQFIKRRPKNDFQDRMTYCEKTLHKVKRGKIERNSKKCSNNGSIYKKRGAGFGGKSKSGKKKQVPRLSRF